LKRRRFLSVFAGVRKRAHADERGRRDWRSLAVSGGPRSVPCVAGRDDFLARLNSLLRHGRARSVRGTPPLRTAADVEDKLRFLLQLVDELEVDRQRQAAELSALKAALAAAQRAYLQEKARHQAAATPCQVEPTWPD
jgi:hypothetical protein